MFINRSTIPQDFYDVVNPGLLRQPIPQFLFATLFKSALGVTLKMNGFGISPERSIYTQGAPVTQNEYDRLILSDPVYTEALTVVRDLGQQPGHLVKMNRPVYLNTKYGFSDRTIAEGQKVSTSPIAAKMEQAEIKIATFAGPYDMDTGQVRPYAVTELSASMSVHDMASLVLQNLKYDYDNFLDHALIGLLDSTTNVLYAGKMTSDNDAGSPDAYEASVSDVLNQETYLASNNIPTFSNGQYVAVYSPRQIMSIQKDPDYQRMASFHAQINPILQPNYIARIGKVDIFRSTTLPIVTNSNPNPTKIYRGYMFGPGAIGVGLGAKMPEVRFSTDDNYALQNMVIWVMFGGFSLLDQRFVVAFHST